MTYSSCGAEWGQDGKATIYAEGHTGEGKISGITPHTAMALAIMLARNARAQGAPWPTSYWDDPWYSAAITGLQVQVEERDPEEDQSPAAFDVTELEKQLDDARSLMRRAVDVLNEAEYRISG